MNILLATGIFPPESGGPATYTETMSRMLRDAGHTVTVVTYGDSGRARRADGIMAVPRRRPVFLRYAAYAWRVFLAARKADVVYAQGPVSEGLPATVGAMLAGRPVVMKVVGDYAWEQAMQHGERRLVDAYLASRPAGILDRVERWTAKRARNVIVPSRYLKTVVERWGVPPERIHVVKNAAEVVEQATQGMERDRVRTECDVQGKTVFLTAVRAVPWKGVAEFIEWWDALPDSHVLAVAGDGPELEGWKELAGRKNLGDRVRFLGRLDRAELSTWYVAADALVLHSGYEGYPHVIPEAVSFGLPCFVSNMGGNPETADDFPGRVTILPYQDRAAWVAALSSFSGGHLEPTFGHTPGAMAAETLRVLAGEADRMRTVMVGFEKQLLDPGSSAWSRVHALGAKDGLISALVVSGGASAEDEAGLTSEFRVFSWRGGSVRRVFRAILQGIREARRLPGRTVVSAQDPFVAGLVGYAVSRWTNSPLEIQEHADFYSGYWARESWKHRALSLFGRLLLRRAERVRVVSERVKTHLVRIGVRESTIGIIPVSQRHEMRFGTCREDMSDLPRLIAPCRFVAQKGLDTLLDAAARLKADGVRFRLDLIGKGPEEAALHAQISRNGLGDVVRIVPWKDPSELWEDADLFVCSSRYEGWARTIVEAMAAGVPVVTTDVGCVGSFFRPGIDGRVVQPDDAAALASAIAEQLTEHERRTAMCHHARARAEEFLSEGELHVMQRAGWRNVLGHRMSNGPRWDLWVAGFLAFAILSRLASAFLFHESLLNREWSFMILVDRWFDGFGYSFALEDGCRSAYRSPAYLFFLTALYAVFPPENTLAQALAQNAIVVGALWLVYAVGKRLVGKRAALIAAFLMAAYPYTFYHYTQYYHTFLSSFFLLLLVWFLLRLHETKALRYAAWSGFGIAALAYVQGTILAAAPFVVLWLFAAWWPNWQRAFKAAVIMAVVSAALIAPWTYRNWTVFHEFIPLTTDLGFGYLKANTENIYALTAAGYPQEVQNKITTSSTNPGFVRYYPDPSITGVTLVPSVMWSEWYPREPIWHPGGDEPPVTDCRDLGPLNEAEMDRFWKGKAREVRAEKTFSELAALHVQKVKTFWQPALFPSQKFGAAWPFADDPVKVWLARFAVTAAASVVVFGGLIGMLIHIRRRDRLVYLPIAILVVYTVLHTFFAGYTKYRVPLDSLLAMYAGFVIIQLWDAIRSKKTL